MTTDPLLIPLYVCHKKVHAFKIHSVVFDKATPSETRLVGEDGYSVPVPAGYVLKHDPQPGGYYVIYEDGYQSWSPAEAFEGGYTLAIGQKMLDDERDQQSQSHLHLMGSFIKGMNPACDRSIFSLDWGARAGTWRVPFDRTSWGKDEEVPDPTWKGV